MACNAAHTPGLLLVKLAITYMLVWSLCRFTDSNKSIYYFKTPDDVPKPNGLRGQIYLGDCIVEDLDERGNPRSQIGNAVVEMQRGDKASLLLRISSKDPRRPCVKDHTSIVLRAENVGTKYEWLARLVSVTRSAAAGGPAPAPAPLPVADGPLATTSNAPDANGNGVVTTSAAPGGMDTAPSDASELLDPLTVSGLTRRNR